MIFLNFLFLIWKDIWTIIKICLIVLFEIFLVLSPIIFYLTVFGKPNENHCFIGIFSFIFSLFISISLAAFSIQVFIDQGYEKLKEIRYTFFIIDFIIS